MKKRKSKYSFSFLINFPLGLFIGTICSFFVAWVIDADLNEWLSDNIATLLAGLLTLFGAAFAVMGVFSQIETQERHRRDERDASLKAARSTLPLALSDLSESCETEFLRLFQTENPPPVVVSNSHLNTLKQCIEFSDNEAGERLSETLRLYQICKDNARRVKESSPINVGENSNIDQSKLENHADTNNNLIDVALLWLQLEVLIESLYVYARKGEPPDDRNELRARLISKLYFHMHVSHRSIGSHKCLETIAERLKKGDPNFRLVYIDPE